MRVLLTVVVVVLVAGCGGGEIEVDCGEPVDFAAWREASERDRILDEGEPERLRRSVAAHLVECGTIDGKSRGEVLALLGRSGLPDDETPRDERNMWEFYLGPDGLKLDSEVMIIEFDRDRWVKEVLVAQS
jgi:hypothetical protein